MQSDKEYQLFKKKVSDHYIEVYILNLKNKGLSAQLVSSVIGGSIYFTSYELARR